MISDEKFFKKFRFADFSKEELARLHCFVMESSILSYAGRDGMPYFIDLEEKFWPLLNRIDEQNLPKGTSGAIKDFIKLINEERKERLKKWQGIKNPWAYLREIISKRTEMLEVMCEFEDEDIARCRAMGETLRQRIKEAKKNYSSEEGGLEYPPINTSDAIAELLYENGFFEGGDEK